MPQHWHLSIHVPKPRCVLRRRCLQTLPISLASGEITCQIEKKRNNVVIDQRIDILSQVGEWIAQRGDDAIEQAILRARYENPWFTIGNSNHALNTIGRQYLNRAALQAFVQKYDHHLGTEPKKVGIIAAGNIPLVGLHDVLCTYLLGHVAMIKLSDRDASLMRLLIEKINDLDPKQPLHLVEKLQHYEAVVATGSNNSASLFRKYFADKPHLIRQNRNAVAVLDGKESTTDVEALGRDIFQYFGLGCRSVSKLYVPEKYDFDQLINGLEAFREVIAHPKYKNNFDYNYATMVINRIPYLRNDFLLFKEDPTLTSRIATIHYSSYQTKEELVEVLNSNRSGIQCVVGNQRLRGWDLVPFGQAQEPALHDFADGIDTIEFLAGL